MEIKLIDLLSEEQFADLSNDMCKRIAHEIASLEFTTAHRKMLAKTLVEEVCKSLEDCDFDYFYTAMDKALSRKVQNLFSEGKE